MAVAVAIFLVVAAIVVLWVAVAREPGPPPEETALAYELAWNRHDFSTLFSLCGDELRDGMDQRAFVAAKRQSVGERAPSAARASVRAEAVDSDGSVAHVVTAVSANEETVRNDVVLERRSGRWVVVGYSLKADQETAG